MAETTIHNPTKAELLDQMLEDIAGEELEYDDDHLSRVALSTTQPTLRDAYDDQIAGWIIADAGLSTKAYLFKFRTTFLISTLPYLLYPYPLLALACVA